MRNLNDVLKQGPTKGFVTLTCFPGQSHKNRGAVFLAPCADFPQVGPAEVVDPFGQTVPARRDVSPGDSHLPRDFRLVPLGQVVNGRQVCDLFGLRSGGPCNFSWLFHGKFLACLEWSGLNFKRTVGVAVVAGPVPSPSLDF